MANRFKALDLIDREYIKSMAEVYNIVQGVDQNHLQGNKCKKTKWLFEEALQTAQKGREAKGKGEKERYTHMNAEFQKIARRDKTS